MVNRLTSKPKTQDTIIFFCQRQGLWGYLLRNPKDNSSNIHKKSKSSLKHKFTFMVNHINQALDKGMIDMYQNAVHVLHIIRLHFESLRTFFLQMIL